jgi:hypothetical protein
MFANMTEAEAEERLAEYRRVTEGRDEMVRDVRAAGINPRQIALRSGLSRQTVYKILGIVPDLE